jgi:hypothetical protein
MPTSLRLLDLLVGRLALVELGRELLAEGLSQGLLEELARLAALGPEKPFVSIFASPVGLTIKRMIFFMPRLLSLRCRP